MSLLMGDIATGRIHARDANAFCNAGGKLLKMVEMQYKYGKPGAPIARADLRLTV